MLRGRMASGAGIRHRLLALPRCKVSEVSRAAIEFYTTGTEMNPKLVTKARELAGMQTNWDFCGVVEQIRFECILIGIELGIEAERTEALDPMTTIVSVGDGRKVSLAQLMLVWKQQNGGI